MRKFLWPTLKELNNTEKVTVELPVTGLIIADLLIKHALQKATTFGNRQK